MLDACSNLFMALFKRINTSNRERILEIEGNQEHCLSKRIQKLHVDYPL